METSKKQKAKEKNVEPIDIELNEEQLEAVAGGGTLQDFVDTVMNIFNKAGES